MNESPSGSENYRRERLAIREGLDEAMTEMLYGLAERVEAFVDRYPEQVNTIGSAHPSIEVPYSVSHWPPHLFEQMGGRPFVPSSEAELGVVLETFWSYNRWRIASSSGLQVNEEKQYQHLEKDLRHAMEVGLTINEADWEQYQSGQRILEEAGFSILNYEACLTADTIHGSDFLAKRGTLELATGQYDSFLFSSTSTDLTSLLRAIRVPIGAYGWEQAERLRRTFSFIIDFIHQDQNLRADISRMLQDPQNLRLIAYHTQRAQFHNSAENATVYTCQEGVASMLAMINWATAERITHYEDDSIGAFAEFCRSDLANKFTRKVPLSIAGSLAVHGVYIPEPVHWQNGLLEITPQADAVLKEIRKGDKADLTEQWREFGTKIDRLAGQFGSVEAIPADLLPKPPVRTGYGCPFVGPDADGTNESDDELFSMGAISRLTPALFKLYNCIDLSVPPPTYRGDYRPWNLPNFLAA